MTTSAQSRDHLTMPTLYIVATPIGNLEDITLRALRILSEVDLIAAEDTRVTRKLLDRHKLRTHLISYHAHNYRRQIPKILKTLIQKNVALVSDAGMPGISDPGAELVNAVSESNIRVVPIPGPSAVTTAISASGLEAEQFIFVGFWPRRSSERKKMLELLSSDPKALVAFETPHRFRKSLSDVLSVLGNRQITVCREMTKIHEEIFRGTVTDALLHFARPIGEFTLVIHGAQPLKYDIEPLEKNAITSLTLLRHQGAKAKEAVSAVVEETGLPKSRVYKMWLNLATISDINSR